MAKQRRAGSGKPGATVPELLAEAGAALIRDDMRLVSQFLLDALRSEPNNPEVHLALGNFHLRLGQASQAEADFQTALNIRPEFAEAAAGIVKVRMAMERLGEAEALSQAFLIRFPNDLLLGQLLAQILVDQSRTAEAITLMRSLVSAYPTAVPTINSLAKRLSEQGDFDESRNYFEQAISADPSNAFAYLGWAQTKTVSFDDGKMVQAMEAALSNRALSEGDRMQIFFALGKTYGDLKEFEKSMGFYREANEIRDRSSQKKQPFQPELNLAYLDLTREIFTRENIESHQSDFQSQPTPIFIVGMFRTGSTLVEQILSSHSSVVAGGELQYWLDSSPACFDLQRRSFDFERAKVLRKPYQQKLRNLSNTAKYVTDKTPGNYRILGLLRILYPKAKLILCTRHPVDTCLSIYMTPFNRPPNYASDPEKLVFTYQLYRKTIDYWDTALGCSNIFRVHYQDLIEHPETVTRNLLDFCELEFEDACLSPEHNERTVTTASVWQVRQPIYQSSAEKWRQFEPWLGEFGKLLG